MFNLVDEAMAQMSEVLKGAIDDQPSHELERQINALREELRSRNTDDVDNGVYAFTVGTIFMDLVRECEKCGDYIINVVEAKMGKKDSVADTILPPVATI